MLNQTQKRLDTHEAAAYLGLSPSTLITWRCRGTYRLAYVKVGGAVRYRQTDLDAFLESRTVRPEGRELQEV